MNDCRRDDGPAGTRNLRGSVANSSGLPHSRPARLYAPELTLVRYGQDAERRTRNKNRGPGWPTGWLRYAHIVHYGATHHRPRDWQIISPVIPHASLCRPNCANGSVAASFATYSPRGMLALTPCRSARTAATSLARRRLALASALEAAGAWVRHVAGLDRAFAGRRGRGAGAGRAAGDGRAGG